METQIKKLRKKEVMYIKKCSKEFDLEVMEALVIKEVKSVEQHNYISLFNKPSSLALQED